MRPAKAFGAAGWLAAVSCAFPSSLARVAPPADLPASTVAFDSPSGSRIRGWYASGIPGRGAVLLLHGVGANRRVMVDRARFLHAAGYAVMLPDFQAHGESPGRFATYGALESLDARAALDFLRARDCGSKVGVIGVSMGGAAVLLGPGPLDADAIVLESVFPSIREATADRLETWLGPAGRLGRLLTRPVVAVGSWRIGVPADSLRPIDRIGSVVAPLFVLAGTADPYTRIAESRALFERAVVPKEWWAVEGARHEDLHAFAPVEYERRVGDFLARTLRGEGGTSTLAEGARGRAPDLRQAVKCVGGGERSDG